MSAAIDEAYKNVKKPAGGPFGACIVKNGRIISSARNTVLKKDATCHAEINAIRKASRITGSYDLSGCEVYSTTEPCPMCFSAIHWAKISTIYYGTTIKDVKKLGFNELSVSNRTLKKISSSSVRLFPGTEKQGCLKLLQDLSLIHISEPTRPY